MHSKDRSRTHDQKLRKLPCSCFRNGFNPLVFKPKLGFGFNDQRIPEKTQVPRLLTQYTRFLWEKQKLGVLSKLVKNASLTLSTVCFFCGLRAVYPTWVFCFCLAKLSLKVECYLTSLFLELKLHSLFFSKVAKTCLKIVT